MVCLTKKENTMDNLLAATKDSVKYMERRKFFTTTLKASTALTLMNLPAMVKAAGFLDGELTIQDVIELILKEIPEAPFKETVDTIKSGSAAKYWEVGKRHKLAMVGL